MHRATRTIATGILGILVTGIGLPLSAGSAPPQPSLEHVHGQDDDASDEVGAEERDRAIRKGFEFIDENAWRMNDYGSPQKHYTLAVTAWASLLAADKPKGAKRLPSRSKEVERIRGFLERYAETVAREYERDDKRNRRRKDDPPATDGFGFDRMMKPSQYVWPLSMTGHFLAESMARGRNKSDSKSTLKQVRLVLEASQQENGGWGHDDASREGMGLPPIQIPKPGGGTAGYPQTLLAASHCALSALGVAHRALREKDDEPLRRGVQYFVSAQSGDGSFPYDPSQQHSRRGTRGPLMELDVARTPGAVFALCCAGATPQDEAVQRALAATDAAPEAWSEGHGSATMALQFAALTARARGDEAWAVFRQQYLRRILDHQHEDGSYDCVARGDSAGVTNDTEPLPGLGGMGDWTASQRVYVTAIHTLILVLDRSEPEALPVIEAPVARPRTGDSSDG